MPSVQFFGINQVIAAAENMDCPAWAIYNGKLIFMKFEGGTMEESIAFLENALNMLAASLTTALYTIKFFETEEGQKIKINEKTVASQGFNFKLVDPEQRAVVQYGGHAGYVAHTKSEEKFDRLTAILEKQQEQINQLLIAQQEENDDEETEPETLTGVLIDTLKNPDKLMSFVGAIRSLMPQQPAQVAAIGSTGIAVPGQPTQVNTQPAQPMSEAESEARLNRLGAAVDFLMSVDPLFIEHLEKLVELEKKTPGKLKSLLAWL